MYDERFVTPMREELTTAGFRELRTAAEVDEVFKGNEGTLLCVVNSVCGCSAAGARPGVKLAVDAAKESGKAPQQLTTVFAGQDKEATEQARTYFLGYAPSSPAVALLKDGQIVYMMERHQIQGYSPDEIASALTKAFEAHC